MLLEELASRYRYIGNFTNAHMAAGLEDMIDSAVEVSYRTLARAVGKDQLKQIFDEYDWSSRPRDLTMRDDYAVSYYRSIFEGRPCYYVRFSGIEYVFAVDTKPSKTRPAKTIMILQDGSLAPVGSGIGVYSVRKIDDVTAEVSQSQAKTQQAEKALKKWLSDYNITSVIEDDEEMDLPDFLNSI